MGISGGGGDGGAAAARAEEEKRQRQIREGTSRINDIFDNNFTDDYFGGRQQSYMDYATPQLNDQYQDALKQLTYSLDRNGTLDSSIRAEQMGKLQKLYDTNRQSVADKALGYGSQARSSVEDARANLISTLNATGDVQGAVNSAMTRSKALSAPDTYSPLGQLFTTFTSGLGQQAAAEKAAALTSGIGGGSSSAGLFGTSKNSVVNQG